MIGNLDSWISFDRLRRYLTWRSHLGYQRLVNNPVETHVEPSRSVTIEDHRRSKYKIQLTRVQAYNFTDVPPFVPNAFTPTIYPISFLTLSGSLDRIEACFESVEYYKHLAWFTHRRCSSISIIDDKESWHVIGNHIGVILIIERIFF